MTFWPLRIYAVTEAINAPGLNNEDELKEATNIELDSAVPDPERPHIDLPTPETVSNPEAGI